MWGFHRLRRTTGKIAAASLLVLLFVVAADAYTIVMRGGRRVEIPARFVVTTSTLTYEVADGIQITIELATVDIPATEKANHQAAGSLLRRSQAGSQTSSDQKRNAEGGINAPRNAPRGRTITNRDLEPSMRRRRESELAYERRRRELGLPSLAESQRRAAVEREAIAAELEQKRAAEGDSEKYWRTRASALRTDMAALDAELSYIRGRLDEAPGFGGSFISVSSIVPFIPFGSVGASRSIRTGPTHRSVFAPPATGHFDDRIRFGVGETRSRTLVNPRRVAFERRVGVGIGFSGFPVAGFPVSTGFGSLVQPYDFSYERSELIARFNELVTLRAGLKARWRELEDEARRAGAPPGWLRE